MYGDVNVSVEDGKLYSSTSGAGVHVKIGVSDVVSSEPIMIKSSMSAEKIIEKLGNTPLADSCMDSVENGSKCLYAIPVQAVTQGTIGSVEKDGEGEGTFAVNGFPVNTFDIIVEICESGNTNTGTVRYSVDGGNSYTAEQTIPLSGTLILGVTGLTVTFTDAEGKEESFIEGTTYTFSTTSPVMGNLSVINAIESLSTFNNSFEFVHIVGATSVALLQSISTLADKFVSDYKRPIFFVCEARNKTASETLDEYITELQKNAKAISNCYIQVVPSYGTYTRMDWRTQDINLAGVLCGLYARARESQSIGEVKSFPISCDKLTALVPDGIADSIELLDSFRYATVRQYYGKEDYFVTSANMMCPEGSDYRYAEDVRVSNRLVREVRLRALDELQSEVDPEDVESSVATLKEELTTPLDTAISDGIISSGSVSIDTENVNILADESLNVEISYVPIGHIREMNLKFSVKNPYS